MVSCTAIWSLACRGAVTCSHRVSRPLTTTNTHRLEQGSSANPESGGRCDLCPPSLLTGSCTRAAGGGGEVGTEKDLKREGCMQPYKSWDRDHCLLLSEQTAPLLQEAKLSEGVSTAGFGKVGMLSPWALGGKDPRPGVLEREEIAWVSGHGTGVMRTNVPSARAHARGRRLPDGAPGSSGDINSQP